MQNHRALRPVPPGAKPQHQPRSLCRETFHPWPAWEGYLRVKIDEHGHVRDVDVKGTTDESVIKPIPAALINWRYEPATINGHPSLGFVQVNVE